MNKQILIVLFMLLSDLVIGMNILSKNHKKTTLDWTTLTTKKNEDIQQFGVEYEIPWISGMYTQACNERDEETRQNVVRNPPRIGGKSFLNWCIENGHKPIYQGKNNFTNWEIHLDGIHKFLFEFVSKPLPAKRFLSNIVLLRDGLYSLAGAHQTFQWIEEHFDETYNNPELYKYMKCHIKRNVAHDIITGYDKIPSSQLTTTLTDKELDSCDSAVSHEIKQFFYPNGGHSNLLSKLRSQTFTPDAKLSQFALIKHAAQQFDSTYVPTFGNFEKVDISMGLNTFANKLAPIHIRDNSPAFVIELRGRDSNVLKALTSFTNKGGSTKRPNEREMLAYLQCVN